VAHLRRWLPVGAAAIATVVLAVGFGLAASQLAIARVRVAPQLKTVPTTTLTRLGLTLTVATQPPYCAVAGTAVEHGWLPAGRAGCAISRSAAEAAALQGSRTSAIESVLATVTSSRQTAIGRDHLTWLVVTQGSVNPCRLSGSGFTTCAGPRGVGWNQLVLVDALGAGVINTLRLTPGGRVARPFPAGGTLNGG
jgi:hypothetical protein